MKTLVLVLFLLLCPAVYGQTQIVVGQQKQLEWLQAAPSQAAAQAYSYKLYVTGEADVPVLPGVTCAGSGSSFTCRANLPLWPIGAYTLTLTARDANLESGHSPALAVQVVAVPVPPVAPQGLGVVP